MTFCSSDPQEDEAKSKEIEKLIAKDKKEFKLTIKILLVIYLVSNCTD